MPIRAGIISDFAKSRFDYPRSYLMVFVAFLVFISQVAAANIDNIHQLWMASALLGLGYGSVFSLLPQVAIEWFGICKSSSSIFSLLLRLTLPDSALLRKLGVFKPVANGRGEHILRRVWTEHGRA